MGCAEDAADGFAEAGPLGAERFETATAGRGEGVVLAAAAFGGCFPLSFEKALFFQAVERGVERAFLRAKLAFAVLLDRAGDLVAVGRACGDDFEHDGLEGGAEEVGVGGHSGQWSVVRKHGVARYDTWGG